MPRTLVEIAADIVEQEVQDGAVATDTYIEGQNAGLNVDALIERAEELYDIATEELEATVNND